jgi:hypothetical protein
MPLGEGTQMWTAAMKVWAPPNRPGRPNKKEIRNKSISIGYGENPRKLLFYDYKKTKK